MRYTFQNIFLIAVLFLFACDSQKNDGGQSLILWYEQPASVWEEALPLGNGRLGAMVFGETSKERIQLNDDSMWPADIGWGPTDGNKEDLEQVRNLLIEGKISEADKRMVEKFSRKAVTR
jgi:alpha-L-fucosidase 2